MRMAISNSRHLRREYGLIINKKKVYRLSHKLGILRPQRSLKPKCRRRIARNRIIIGPNQLFETDIKFWVHSWQKVSQAENMRPSINVRQNDHDSRLTQKFHDRILPHRTRI